MKQTTLSLIAATLLLSPAFAAEDLGEIVVTSTTKVPQKLKNSTANVTVITAEEIQERGYQSVPEVLSHISGISVSQNGGAGQKSSIFMRGMESHDILIMVDGTAMIDYTAPYASPIGIEHINIHDIQRIEIIKGAQSGIWGASAVAGVINIITKLDKEDHAAVRLSAGSYGTKGTGFALSKSNETLSFYLSGNIDDTDGISALSPSSAEKDGNRNKDLNLRSTFKVGTSSDIGFFYHNNTSTFDYDATGNPNSTVEHGTSKLNSYGLTYNYKNSKLTVAAKASATKIERLTVGAYGPMDSEGNRKNISLTSSYLFNPNQILTVGAEHTKTDGENTYSPIKTFKNNALFANYSYTVDDLWGAKTTFNAALRYDDFDIFKDKSTYRFGVKRACIAIDGLHSSFNIYSAYKAPSFYQLANPRTVGTTLLPEYTQGYELSVGYKKLLNITYFKNKKEDEILYDDTTYTYYNDTNTKTVDGIELSSEYSVGDTGVILGMNYTHLFDKELLRRAQNSANLFADYYFGDNSHIGLNLHYEGERRDLDYSTWPASDVILDSYTTVDLTYNTRFNDNLSLTVTAKNIFDEQYETVKSYSTEGRSIYATMEYKF